MTFSAPVRWIFRFCDWSLGLAERLVRWHDDRRARQRQRERQRHYR